MNFLVRISTSLLAVAVFLTSGTAYAQMPVGPGVDIGGLLPDFRFDDLSDPFRPIDECDKCKLLEIEIAAKEARIAQINAEIADIKVALANVDQSRAEAEEAKSEAQEKLKEMQDPQSYVESDGRRYDSSDHAAMQRRNARLWGEYKSGDLSAQEYSDEVGKDFDDPDVAKELEKLKEEIENELQEEIDGQDDVLAALDDFEKELNDAAKDLTDELEDCLDALEQLMKDKEECEKKCRQQKVGVEDLGITPEGRGLFDRFFDLFRGPPLILPDPDTIVERLDPPTPGGVGEIPTEIIDLELKGMQPLDVDSFFDVTTPIVVLPESKCQMCDPLAAEIAAKEAKLAADREALKAAEGILDMMKDHMESGKDMIDDMRESLKNLQNPSDYVESEGRRYDGSDHAAMQVRHQRLWADYRAGRLSASGLEAEWEKPFDDPDVAKELEEIKEQMEEELDDAVEAAEDALRDLQENMDAVQEGIDALNEEIANCAGMLAAMKVMYEDCLKRCKEVNDAVGFIEDLIGDDPPWQLPEGGFTLPIPEDEPEDKPEDTSACMTGRECEETCVPEGKACVEVSKEGKTCFVCSDNNDCADGTVNLKVCEQQCVGGSCSRSFTGGPACFRCTGCLKPSTTRRACEETCVVEGGQCIQNKEAGESCFDCDRNNPCKEPGLTLPECEERCGSGSCSRDNSLGGACFRCDGCLKPHTSLRVCEETCLEKGGQCMRDMEAGEKCYGCSMDNPCDSPAMNYKECLNSCDGSCTRNEKAGGACFTCDKPRVLEEDFTTSTPQPKDPVAFIDGLEEEQEPQQSFFCRLPIIKGLCPDPTTELNADGNLVVSNIGSSGEDGVRVDLDEGVTGDFALPYVCCGEGQKPGADCKKCDEDGTPDLDSGTGFLCDKLGFLCPLPTLDYIAGCASGGQGSQCDSVDQNGDGVVDLTDLEEFTPTLVGPGGIDFPLIINGLDGNDDLSIGDFSQLGDCLSGGPANCDGLQFGNPGDDVLLGDDILGLNGGDFRPQLVNGSDVILGDPLDPNLIGIGGGSDDLLGPDLGDNLFGGPADPIPLPPGGGIGLDILGDSNNDDFPPPPDSSQQNMANDPQVKQVVAAAVAAYLRQNPLGPCEKLVVTVRRVRVGNRVSYTVRIRRVFDPSKCPRAACPPGTSYEAIFPPTQAECSEACQNGTGGCVVTETLPDGTNCILCGPPIFDDPDLGGESSGEGIFQDGFESGDTQRWDDQVDDPGPGPGPAPAPLEDLCEDESRCDDGDECTQDDCNPETGECIHVPIVGCGVTCPDFAHDSIGACNSNCANGFCNELPTARGCYLCTPEEVEEIPSPGPVEDEFCDEPLEEKEDCERSCNGGICKKQYTRPDGVNCYSCQLQCDDGTETLNSCEDSCDGTCTKNYTRDDGVKCYECVEEEEEEEEEEECPSGSVDSCSACPGNTNCEALSDSCFTCEPISVTEDEGPSCPSGTTDSQSDCESQCPSDGVCIGEDGCYSCVVVNCPDGTYRDECPSNCSNGCDVVGQQHGVSCYQCKQDCETLCAENGYGPESTDHSNAILGELNGYNCVSGANISIQTATIGDCRCIGDYSLQVDPTPPVCQGTPCGDVECGGSASCPGGPNETITVNCNWGGWEKLDKHLFRPVVGN